MKRVLHIFSSLNLAGAESRIMDLYRVINKEELQFDFITVKPGPYFFEDEIKKLGGRIFCITDPQKSIFKNIRDMIKVMKQNGPYIAVHSHTSYYNGIAMYAAYRAKIKIRISHARNSSNNKLNIKKWMQVYIGRLLIKLFATDRISISKPAAKFIFGTTKNIKILPNAIDINRFVGDRKEKTEKIKKQLNIKDEKIMIMVARFIEFKNHRFAIDVLEELVKNNKYKYRLLFAGTGDIQKEIEDYVKSKKLQENVMFLGVRTDIPILDKIADLFLVPSKFEGLCGACIEAQASGTKCLISNEVPEEVDMNLGLIYRESIHEGPKMWSEKIEEILDKRESKELTKEEIIEKFKMKKFTLEEEREEILRLYGME